MELICITRKIWIHNGEVYLPASVIQQMAKNLPKPKAEITPLPTDAQPKEWLFDDNKRTVNIGCGSVKLGRIQYGLLKFVAKGETDIQNAWVKVWEYQSMVEWRVVKGAAVAINQKLEQYSSPFRIVVNTREVKIIPI